MARMKTFPRHPGTEATDVIEISDDEGTTVEDPQNNHPAVSDEEQPNLPAESSTTALTETTQVPEIVIMSTGSIDRVLGSSTANASGQPVPSDAERALNRADQRMGPSRDHSLHMRSLFSSAEALQLALQVALESTEASDTPQREELENLGGKIADIKESIEQLITKEAQSDE